MNDLFLKLLNMSVTAGWVVLALVAVRLIFRKLPKRALCALWGIAGLRLVLPFSFQSALSLIPSTQTVQSNGAGDPVIYSGFPAINTVVNPVISQTQTVVGSPIGAKTLWNRFLDAAPYLWLCGAALMLAWAAISWLRVKQRTRESVPLEKGVYLCESIPSPFILGLVRPRIYLPAGLTGEEERFVLDHERTHLRRFDHVWKPLGFLLLSVYWFNPLLWVAYILLCRDIESACDEQTIAQYSDGQRAMYAQTLLDHSAKEKLLSACPVAFGETGVKGRIRSVLSYKKPALWIIVGAVVLSAALAAVLLADPKKTGAPKSVEEAAGRYILDETDGYPPRQPTVNLYKDGTFWFSPGIAVSFAPHGEWNLERGNRLALRASDEEYYIFKWDGDGYAYKEKESAPSTLFDPLPDGTVFVPESKFDGYVFLDSSSEHARIKLESCSLTGKEKQAVFRIINDSEKNLFYGADLRLYRLLNDGTSLEEIELPPHTPEEYALKPGVKSDRIVFDVPDGLDLTENYRIEADYRIAEDQEDEAYRNVYTALVFFGGLESAQATDGWNIDSQSFDIDADGEAETVEIERSGDDVRDMTVIRARKGGRILGELCIPISFASDLAFYPDAQTQPTIRAKLDNREMYGKQPGNDIIYLNIRLDNGKLRLFNMISGDEFPWINENTIADLGTSYIITNEVESPAQRIRFTLNPKGDSFRMAFGTDGDWIDGIYKEAEDGTLTLIYDSLGKTETFVFTGGQHVFNREKSSSDADGRLRDGAVFFMLIDVCETDVDGDGTKEWLYLADGGTSGFRTYDLIAENQKETLFHGGIIAYQGNNLRLSELIDGSVRIKSEKFIFNANGFQTTPDDGYYITEFIDVKLQRGGFHFYCAGTDTPYEFANV